MPPQTRRFLGVACFLMLACLVPLHLLGVDILFATVTERIKYLAWTVLAFGVLCLLKRAPLVRLLLEVTIWSMLVSSLVNLPIALFVRLPVPFVDRAAQALDSRLGLNAAAWVQFAATHRHFRVLCKLAYVSLRPVDILTLYVPVLARRPRWLSEMFVALVLQLCATAVIMCVAQAVGPWVVNGVAATERQAEITDVMLRIKHAPTFRLDMGDIPGFVAFPSWHVMLAMLSALTIGRVRVLREVCIVWVVLVAISTLTTGWHYGIDVLSGVVVAGLSMLASKHLHRRWDASLEPSTAQVELAAAR
jgi:membrane-associated phospholipid phosphatase